MFDQKPRRYLPYLLLLLLSIVVTVTIVTIVATSPRSPPPPTSNMTTPPPDTSRSSSNYQSLRLAHIGNSIQYYNDLPRLLQHMLQTKYPSVQQDSCLRGGATLPSLWEKGNGMAKKFSEDIGAPTVAALLAEMTQSSSSNTSGTTTPEVVVILNDHSQSPARSDKEAETLEALQANYIPMFQDGWTIVFIQTAAYRSAVKESSDLGTFDEFTAKLLQGYQHYAQLVQSSSNNYNKHWNAKVAPVGQAFQYIRKHYGEDEWARLYARDDFHPSPHGTWLEASVLYCTIVQEMPPTYQSTWWDTARYMQPPDSGDPLPLPTDSEAAVLASVAWTVCCQQQQQQEEEDGN